VGYLGANAGTWLKGKYIAFHKSLMITWWRERGEKREREGEKRE